jgi:SAM-dependent methyltransferase
MTVTPVSRDDRRRRAFPEIAAGGYSRKDGTIEFHLRVNSLLLPDDVVLDLGAGRGFSTEDPVPVRRDLRCLRGKVQRVIGIDVDPVVLANQTLDEALVIAPSDPLPLADQSVDMVVSDWTIEHIDEPGRFVSEIDRVLKPGGWFCARTPNKWGYIGIAARLVPNEAHTRVLRRLQPHRNDHDTFPVRYRLNTQRELERHFVASRWANFSYTHDAEPAYAGHSRALWALQRATLAAMPKALSSVHMIFMQKLA